MKHTILLLSVSILLLASCVSSRSMQKEINQMRSDLSYELMSAEYIGKVKDTVYLDFINYSNTDYYSTIKRNGGFIVPLLIYNFQKDKFRTRLGEFSLSQLYREFLTDALLTECNSSTCFQLMDNKDKLVPSDSVYRLEIKIMQNETTGGVVLNKNGFIWFEDEYVEVESCQPRSSQTQLSLNVRLSRKGDCLLDKKYKVTHKTSLKRRKYEDSFGANQACLDDMAECLSLATREMVESVSQELHLLMSIQ